MNDLVDFLRARLAEYEQAARQAADFGGGIHGYHWRVSGTYADDGGTYWGIVATAVAGSHEQVVEVVGCGVNSGGGAHTEQVAHHAVRHDPARVLREVEAKRRIVDAYLPPGADPHPGLPCTDDIEHDPNGEVYAEMLYPDACVRHLKASERLLHHDYVLRLLALPFSDHPDYRQEWSPDA